MKNEFHIPPNKIRRILIVTTEEKHRELRLWKAMLGKTWEELLVDFQILLMHEIEEAGLQGVMKLVGEEFDKQGYVKRESTR